MTEERQLYDLEAERGMLSCLFQDPDILDAYPLQTDDFYNSGHAAIFEAIMQLKQLETTVDPVTVAAQCQQNGKSAQIEGIGQAWDILLASPTTAPAKAYRSIVAKFGEERRLVNFFKRFLWEVLQEGEVDYVDRLARVDKFLKTERERKTTKFWWGHFDYIQETLDSIEIAAKKPALASLITGLQGLDEKLGGLTDGTVITLAGRPSMGKSALALNMAVANTRRGKTIGVISLEMSRVELCKRLLSLEQGQVSMFNLVHGQIAPDGWTALVDATQSLQKQRIFIADPGMVDYQTIRNKAKLLRITEGLDLLIIDYLQLLTFHGKTDNRAALIGEMTTGIKQLAMEMGIPIILVSQLNRSCEQREDKRPHLSDLRESGAIEQDSDVVIFVYRDEVYHKKSPDKGTAELLIRKNRNGPTGDVKVNWTGERTLFENLVIRVP